MAENKKTLTKNEWILMSVLWNSDHPLVVSEIIEELQDKVKWGYSTYITQLGRLCEKGFVDYTMRSRRRFFYPAAGMDECIQAESESIKARMSKEASHKLLLHMLQDTDGLSRREEEELQALVTKLKNRSK